MNITINDKLMTDYPLTKHVNLSEPEFRNEEGKLNEKAKAEKAKRLLIIELDFDGCGKEEFEFFLSSQTTPLKMLYNNVLSKWADAKVLEEVKKGTYTCNVKKDLLDNRQSRSLTDEQRIERGVKKQLDKGKSIEQVKKEYMETIKRLEAELG